MNNETHPNTIENEPEHQGTSSVTAYEYDNATAEGGWDSPERAQRLVDSYIKDGTLVLDIGTGTGQAVEGYVEKGAMVVALDQDSDMLALARERIGDKGVYRIADINSELPLEDINGLVDVTQAIGVLEFAKDLPGLMGQVELVLSPNGVFVFTIEEPLLGGELTEHYADINVNTYRHTSEEVKKLLIESGFKLLRDESYVGYDRGDNQKVPYHIYLAQKSQ